MASSDMRGGAWVPNLDIDRIIIIISLFQEDNIFGTNASLTYGPRLQR